MSLWDDNWKKLQTNSLKATSLDEFASGAYRCFNSFFDVEDRLFFEAGCGTGRFCIKIAEERKDSHVIGMDLSDVALKLALKGKELRSLNNVHFLRGDIFKMPVRDDLFDVVFNEGVIEHFHDFEKTIDEMIRITRPEGKIIIAVPNWYCFPHTIYKKIVGDKYLYGYEKSFKHNELISIFKDKGLSEIEVTGFNPTHSIKRLSRLFRPPAVIIDKLIIEPLDRISENEISTIFGIQFVIKGLK